MRSRHLLAILVVGLLVSSAFAQDAKRPMSLDDFFQLRRVSDAQISPDGKHVVYAVGAVDMDKNRIARDLWLASTAKDKPARRQLTSADKSDTHPRWSPDGKSILFESTRSGTSQLWIIDVAGGEARQLTTISTGAATGIWSRDGKKIAFVSAVWPDWSAKPFAESDALSKKKIDDDAKNPVKAHVWKRLFTRHWDEWVEDKRQHLFVVSYDGKASEPRDVTPGDRDAYPTSTTFSVGDDFTFSPDGQHLVFTAVPAKHEAWSTNHDVCRVPVTGSAEWENLTEDNKAADGAPQYSPDGKWLAYRAQKKAGFEADKWDLMILPAGRKALPMCLTTEFTGSVDSFVWLPDSETIYFASEERCKEWYFSTNVHREDGNARLTFLSQHSNHELTVSSDGKTFAFLRSALDRPPEVLVATRGPSGFPTREVSQTNAALLAKLALPAPESVPVQGAGGTPMQMWILKPPGFDPKKKWPLAFLVHGGPQGAWEDDWSNRWNPEMWAAQGYVVALPNPRGSTGFGQQYVDEISGDWGGKVYEDLMAGLAHMEKQPWIDKERMAAAGASFGGYMMNWFAVNTGKFKTLITHDGVWNFDSMYATTDELWFDEWEHGGPPWGTNRESYEKFSPHRKAANLGKFKTPMLSIHNDLDFRVPFSEGLQLFTTLQRQGVPSKMIEFPDEGHWVLKPRNSRYWHNEVFAWLEKHVPPGGR
ncbi:MAG TPA: S9 family peptidase [Gemmataceae bacterium]|nr:S9 family peptidase [Gemmataceae bacterium]